LIHSSIKKAETAKGTNWEQTFQNPQNENICLTNLNVDNNGKFPILSFRNDLMEKTVANKICKCRWQQNCKTFTFFSVKDEWKEGALSDISQQH